jgi:hypothetical protein
MSTKLTEDDIVRLEEIRDEIAERMNEAKKILNGVDPTTRIRAARYWIAEIEVALGGETEWLKRSGHSMKETIEALRSESGEDEK